jgi:hypothetical protein
MAMLENNEPTLRELRQFGLIMGGMILLMAGLVLPWIWSEHWWQWPFPTAGLFWLAALTLPAALAPVYHAWMRLALVLAWINSRVILGIAFFLILIPIGVVFKILKRDPMARRFEPGLESYRTPKQSRDPGHYRKPF